MLFRSESPKDADVIKNLIGKHAINYNFSPDPEFATSPIKIEDEEYDFSVDLSLIPNVEKESFRGTENESAIGHMDKLSALSSLFSDDDKKRSYYVTKLFPFSLKDEAKTWLNNLSPGSIKSPSEFISVFFKKYYPASVQHAALQ